VTQDYGIASKKENFSKGFSDGLFSAKKGSKVKWDYPSSVPKEFMGLNMGNGISPFLLQYERWNMTGHSISCQLSTSTSY